MKRTRTETERGHATLAIRPVAQELNCRFDGGPGSLEQEDHVPVLAESLCERAQRCSAAAGHHDPGSAALRRCDEPAVRPDLTSPHGFSPAEQPLTRMELTE
jgi:hypothetical protein